MVLLSTKKLDEKFKLAFYKNGISLVEESMIKTTVIDFIWPEIKYGIIITSSKALEAILNKSKHKSLKKFPKLFENFWYEGIAKKLGLSSLKSGDEVIIKLLLELMFEDKTDFTQTFRLLSDVFDKKGYQNFQSLFQNKKK